MIAFLLLTFSLYRYRGSGGITAPITFRLMKYENKNDIFLFLKMLLHKNYTEKNGRAPIVRHNRTLTKIVGGTLFVVHFLCNYHSSDYLLILLHVCILCRLSLYLQSEFSHSKYLQFP